jgi:hypothetical protein
MVRSLIVQQSTLDEDLAVEVMGLQSMWQLQFYPRAAVG